MNWLTVFADADGLCEMDQMVEVASAPGHPEGLLLIAIQRQDRSGSWWVAGDAVLALVDIATEPGTLNWNHGPFEGDTIAKTKFVRHPDNPEYYCHIPSTPAVPGVDAGQELPSSRCS